MKALLAHKANVDARANAGQTAVLFAAANNQLECIKLLEAAGANLLRCYEKLVQHGILPRKELPLVKAWLGDLKEVNGRLAL